MGADIVSGPGGIIALVLAFIVFAALLSVAVKPYRDQLTGEAKDLATNTSLITFLRSPTADGTMGSALARAAASGDFITVHTDVQRFLAALPKPEPQFPEFLDRMGWGYHLLRLPEGEELDRIPAIPANVKYTAKRAAFVIPSYDPAHDLEVVFTLECEPEVDCHG